MPERGSASVLCTSSAMAPCNVKPLAAGLFHLLGRHVQLRLLHGGALISVIVKDLPCFDPWDMLGCRCSALILCQYALQQRTSAGGRRLSSRAPFMHF